MRGVASVRLQSSSNSSSSAAASSETVAAGGFWEEAQLKTVFQPVLPGTDRASSLAPWDFLTFSEVIAFCARIAILLKVREVLHHDSLLLASDGSAALLFHQIEHSLAVLTFSCVALVFVLRERLLCDEIGIAQLAHQGPTDDGIVCKGPQLIAINLRTRHICPHYASRRGSSIQESFPVLLCEFRVRCVCVGNEVQVLPEASLQGSGAIAAGEQEQILIQFVLGLIRKAIPWIWRLLGFFEKLC